MVWLGLLALVILLLVLRQSLVLVLAVVTAYLHVFVANSKIEFLIQDFWFTVDREVLLSVPLFMLAGNVMSRGSIAKRLINFMSAFTAPIPGGLAVACVLSCAAFAAINGSSIVTMLAVGAIMHPALVARVPLVLLVNPGRMRSRTAMEWLSDLGRKPMYYRMASAGLGSSSHVYAEILRQQEGLRFKFVHFRGAGPALQDLLAGSVDMVTRRPTTDEFKAVQQFGAFGQANTELFAARAFTGGALTANFNYNTHDTVDADGNKVSEYSGYERKLGGIGFFFDDVGGFKIRGRLDLVDEKRMGGAMGDNYGKVKRDESGNPFRWNKGKNASPSPDGWVAVAGTEDGTVAPGGIVPYSGGQGGMSEIIFTDRQQFEEVVVS